MSAPDQSAPYVRKAAGQEGSSPSNAPQPVSAQSHVTNEIIPPYSPHTGERSQYLRDVILGVNDGLVSMFLLILGVSGGGLNTRQIFLVGVTGAIAGAISMGLGEFIATKSQNQVIEADIKLEKDEHFKFHRQVEEMQVRELFSKLGVAGTLLDKVVQSISSSDDTLLTFMRKVEFGEEEGKDRSPAVTALISCSYFIIGSLPSVVPFACTSDPRAGVIAAAVLCCIACFAVGAIKTITTKGNLWTSGIENLFFAGAGAGLSYGIGALYEHYRSKV